MKNIMKISAAALATIMLFSVFVLSVQAAEPELIAEFDFSSADKIAGEKLDEYASASDDNCYLATTGTATLDCSVSGLDNRKLEWSKAEYGESGTDIVPILAAGNNNPWGECPYVEIEVSTLGLTDLRFTMSLAGSKKAPANWELQYSTDGEGYFDIPESAITLDSVNRKVLTQYYRNFVLPEACEDLDTMYLRIISNDTTTIGGGLTTDDPTGGELALNFISLAGIAADEPATPDETTPDETTPDETTPDEASGDEYLLGDADLSEEVNIRDATAIQRHAAELITLTDKAFTCADVDFNGSVNVKDATAIQKYIASLDVEYPIGQWLGVAVG